MLRDVDSVHAITCTGFVTEHGFGEAAPRRHMVAGGDVERVETQHGVVVIVCKRGVWAYCRRSVQCCELHRLADARPEHVRAINILSDTVFVIVLRSIVVTYHWSDTMHRFVWHSQPNGVYLSMPVVCSSMGYYVSLSARHVHLFYLCPDSDVVPIQKVELTLRGAQYLGTTRNREYMFVIATASHHTDVAVYRLYDMHLVDEVTIDLAGDFYIDGHMFTIVDRTRTQRSACYDHRTGRTAYYAGEPQHDAWIMDDDMAVTYRLTEGFCFH